jgi:hypothetical protein
VEIKMLQFKSWPLEKKVTEYQKIHPQLQFSNSPTIESQLQPCSGGVVVEDMQADDSPFRRMVGIGIRRQPTEEIMRETRGEDSMR